MKIGDIVRNGLGQGLTDEQIIAAVLKEHPDAKTSKSTIAWYRSDMKKTSPKVKTQAESTTALVKPIAQPQAAEGAPHYEVKGLKFWTGTDGQGYEGTLYRNGKKVATFLEEGGGGEPYITWVDRLEAFTTGDALVWDNDLKKRVVKLRDRMTPEEARLWAHVLTLPAYVSPVIADCVLEMTPDLFIDCLVGDWQLLQKMKRMLKGKVVLIDGGKLYTIKAPWTNERGDALRKKYPNATFLNMMSEGEAFELFKGMAQ